MEEELGEHPEIARAISTRDYRYIWGEFQAKQGVLLLNTALTVERGDPNSHSLIWREFTKQVINKLLDIKRPVTWILWGGEANDLLDECLSKKDVKHTFIRSSHPSPYSWNKKLRDYPSFKEAGTFKKIKDKIRWLK